MTGDSTGAISFSLNTIAPNDYYIVQVVFGFTNPAVNCPDPHLCKLIQHNSLWQTWSCKNNNPDCIQLPLNGGYTLVRHFSHSCAGQAKRTCSTNFARTHQRLAAPVSRGRLFVMGAPGITGEFIIWNDGANDATNVSINLAQALSGAYAALSYIDTSSISFDYFSSTYNTSPMLGGRDSIAITRKQGRDSAASCAPGTTPVSNYTLYFKTPLHPGTGMLFSFMTYAGAARQIRCHPTAATFSTPGN